MCTPFCPTGHGNYFKLSADLCSPFMIVPKDDGTIDGTMQGIYQKKEAKTATGAPASSEEMAR